MRFAYAVPALIAAFALTGRFSTAHAAEPFVRGHTTVAMAEQVLGAPADTEMAGDGALTLIYPVDRFAERLPGALPMAAAHARPVSLRFSTDFTYRRARAAHGS